MTSPDPTVLALPRMLRPRDTLAVVAPASPFDRESFQNGVQVLGDMGFRLHIPEEIFAASGYLAGGDHHRAGLIKRLFVDPSIAGIVCARGGYGAMRILPLLNADAISRHPKVFVGFSDITVLLSFLVSRCQMVAFHGPTVTTLGRGDGATGRGFLSALADPTPLAMVASPAHVIQAGAAVGPFWCGNLTLWCHLTGTAFQPDWRGGIVLIEDQGEAPYRIDRMLTHMRLAGCFDKLAGLALGTFSNCGGMNTIRRIVADRLGGLDIPILGGFAVGHGDVNLTLPMGLPVQLDTATGTLKFTQSALSPI